MNHGDIEEKQCMRKCYRYLDLAWFSLISCLFDVLVDTVTNLN